MFRTISFIIMVSFISGIFFWAVFAPKEDVSLKIERQLEEQKKRSDLYIKGVTFSEIVRGVKYWEIKALTSQVNKDKGMAELKDVNGTFFKRNIPSMKFISPRVDWDMNKKEIVIDDIIGFEKDMKFKAPRVRWSLDSQRISSEGEVFFEQSGSRLRADILNADAGLDTIEFSGKAGATVSSSGRTIDVKADRFLVDGRSGTVMASGTASARSGELSILSGVISFDKRSYSIGASKNVRIKFRDTGASAENATYNTRTETVTLSGNAKAEKEDSKLSGNTLKLDLRNNKMSVEGRSKVFIDDEVISREVK